MAIELIELGDAPNDGNGDSLRTAFAKVNALIEKINASPELLKLLGEPEDPPSNDD